MTTYSLQRAAAAETDRIGGSKPVYEPVGNVSGHLSSLLRSYEVELHGGKISAEYSLICTPDTDIREADRVELPDGTYTVVRVLTYCTHKSALLERKGAL